MSGFSQNDATGRGAAAGLAGFLQKPFLPGALRQLLRKVLGEPKQQPRKTGGSLMDGGEAEQGA